MTPMRDEGILQELHAEYRDRLLRYALSILRNREDAEDAVQTVFTNAYRSIEAGRMPRNREAWIFQITKNVCMNRLRTRRRKPSQTIEGLEVAATRTTEDALLDRLHVQAFWRAVERLPEAQRQAVVLREVRGATYREIAQTLDTSESAVESLLFRARRGLQDRMTTVDAAAAA